MKAEFKDHFSDRAARYATYRPHYPPALADYLAGVAPARGTAWDVGCGSGQLSTLLGDRFDHVIATDASADQIARAVAHAKVEYAVATAESAPIDGRSIDLIAVAQAAHWFDLPRFYKEARRVARLNAAIALITYGITRVEGSPGAVVDHFYFGVLEKWWLPERRNAENGYRQFDFPFNEVEPPVIEMAVDWSVDQLIGYVGTWSAVRAMEKAEGGSATSKAADELRAAWGTVKVRRVSWPLTMRIGRIT
jgi:SAM-dependent methyltransferase